MSPSEAAGNKQTTDPANDPEALREEIRETREELGATVEELSEKADVKSQVSGKVDELKGKVTGAGSRVGEATPDDAKRLAAQAQEKAAERPMPAIAGAFAAGLFLGLMIGRR